MLKVETCNSNFILFSNACIISQITLHEFNTFVKQVVMLYDWHLLYDVDVVVPVLLYNTTTAAPVFP